VGGGETESPRRERGKLGRKKGGRKGKRKERGEGRKGIPLKCIQGSPKEKLWFALTDQVRPGGLKKERGGNVEKKSPLLHKYWKLRMKRQFREARRRPGKVSHAWRRGEGKTAASLGGQIQRGEQKLRSRQQNLRDAGPGQQKKIRSKLLDN